MARARFPLITKLLARTIPNRRNLIATLQNNWRARKQLAGVQQL
jgi:hypothetical protein